jgi:hypothetical protein
MIFSENRYPLFGIMLKLLHRLPVQSEIETVALDFFADA